MLSRQLCALAAHDTLYDTWLAERTYRKDATIQIRLSPGGTSPSRKLREGPYAETEGFEPSRGLAPLPP